MVEVGPAAPVAESEPAYTRHRRSPHDRARAWWRRTVGTGRGSSPGARDPRGRSPRDLALVSVLILIALLAGLACWRAFADPTPLSRAEVDAAVKEGIERAAREQANSPAEGSAVYQKILPSLVSVSVTAGAGSSGAGPSPSPAAGAGSASLGAGVVVNPAGAVMTALHVVEPAGAPAGRITLTFTDGTVSGARVVQRTPERDIAVLQPTELPSVVVPAVLAGEVAVGDRVYPVGNPFGLTQSLSAGVVSGTDRTLRTGTGGRSVQLEGLIQFDAAVNPGNSGGPLLNRAGQVAGIVTGLVNPSDSAYFVGIGFAVPIASAAGGGGPQR